MRFTLIKELPSPSEIKKQYPLSADAIQLKKDRETVDQLLTKAD